MKWAFFVFGLGAVLSQGAADAAEPSSDFKALSQRCAPNVAPSTMAALVTVESSHNPYAIGVVGGRLARQPSSRSEAIATVVQLEKQGKNFSMGMAQINKHNMLAYRITYDQVFDSCANLRVGAQILEDCYRRALPLQRSQQLALRAALSCYYSGNFSRGFRPNKAGDTSYVEKVIAAALPSAQLPVVPAIEPERQAQAPLMAAKPVLIGATVEVDKILENNARVEEKSVGIPVEHPQRELAARPH